MNPRHFPFATPEESRALAKDTICRLIRQKKFRNMSPEQWEDVLVEFANEILGLEFITGWDLGDLPFEPIPENKLKLFKMLDQGIQNEAFNNGMSDTVFRDKAFTDICRKVLHLEPEEYYSSCTFMDFKATGHYISIE